MQANEIRFETYGADEDYDVLIVAYGTVARVCLTAIQELAEKGVKAAIIRPVTLFPFPYKAIREAAEKSSAVLVVELSTGQMIEDVELALKGSREIHFHCRLGGMLVTPEEVIAKVEGIVGPVKKEASDG
jgi:2-oxoglutarate ferredoxin oxidoreductase subunit alpha